MNYTAKYPQVSKDAARSKFRRMQAGTGRRAQQTFEAWFSTWWMGKDDDNKEYAIYAHTTYHPKEQLDRMYKTNCKTF
jgi:hypothetical protein